MCILRGPSGSSKQLGNTSRAVSEEACLAVRETETFHDVPEWIARKGPTVENFPKDGFTGHRGSESEKSSDAN